MEVSRDTLRYQGLRDRTSKEEASWASSPLPHKQPPPERTRNPKQRNEPTYTEEPANKKHGHTPSLHRPDHPTARPTAHVDSKACVCRFLGVLPPPLRTPRRRARRSHHVGERGNSISMEVSRDTLWIQGPRDRNSTLRTSCKRLASTLQAICKRVRFLCKLHPGSKLAVCVCQRSGPPAARPSTPLYNIKKAKRFRNGGAAGRCLGNSAKRAF